VPHYTLMNYAAEDVGPTPAQVWDISLLLDDAEAQRSRLDHKI